MNKNMQVLPEIMLDLVYKSYSVHGLFADVTYVKYCSLNAFIEIMLAGFTKVYKI